MLSEFRCEVSANAKSGRDRVTARAAWGQCRYRRNESGGRDCEPATVGRSLGVEHEEDAENDHQKGPEAREGHLPSSGQLRQSLDNANAESGDREAQVLGLDVSHYGHVAGTMHTAVVFVKKEHHRTAGSKYWEQPRGPKRFQDTAGALNLDDSESEENHGKGRVLHVFEIVGETVPPALRTKGPQLRVAEDEQKQPRKQKTSGPRKAKKGPAAGQQPLPAKKKDTQAK